MSKEQVFFKNFIESEVLFFASPLPSNEEAYNANYTLAMTDWLAIQSQLDNYRLTSQMHQMLKQLFELAKKFNLFLKGSGRTYSSSAVSHIAKWSEIQALAKKIRGSSLY